MDKNTTLNLSVNPDVKHNAEVDYKYQTIYTITYNCLIKLLGDQKIGR